MSATPHAAAPGKLTLDDIADLRAYEREREAFRAEVIELKKRRRLHVGPVLTLLFENRTTMRFQIQEMARVERLLSDEAIEQELAIYNPLIPDPGQLCATMFLELTDEAQLREWLPALVGIERAVALRLADGTLVGCVVDEAHEAQLTREDITASVHYVRFELTPDQVDAFAAGPVALVSTHPRYPHEAVLPKACRDELLRDLQGL